MLFSLNKKYQLQSVADPGFPVGGVPTHWGGTNLQRIHFLVKTYAKTKEIDPVGGGALLDPPMTITYDCIGLSTCLYILAQRT